MPHFTARDIGLCESAFDNGRFLGEAILQDPDLLRFIQNGREGFPDVDAKQIDGFTEAAERYLPDLVEELSGCSEVLHIPYEELCYYVFRGAESYNRNHLFCSQFALLPRMARAGHVLTGQSYEWSAKEEHIHATNYGRKISFMGFTLFFFGRWNGLNDRGLSVNQTAVVGAREENPQVVPNHIIVRILLERCDCTEDAIALFEELPKAGWGATLGIADRHGHAALINFAASSYAVERPEESDSKDYILSTNHYTLPSMYPYEVSHGVHSVLRYNAIKEWIQTSGSDIDREDLKRLLSSPFPKGPCCHHYEDGLGTIRSVIYDLADRQAEVCFGSPMLNAWHHMDFSQPGKSLEKFTVEYQNAVASQRVWDQLPPGSTDVPT